MNTDLNHRIENALSDFAKKPLAVASVEFLNLLGYKSDRRVSVDSIEAFCAQFDSGNRLNHPTALKDQWKSIQLLFQITDQELSEISPLFKDVSIQQDLIQSYVFFALELKGDDYPRGKLTGIVRQINRLFPMPVMVLLKHGEQLSIGVINRRRNKIQADKDVLEKVALIRGISLKKPHRGHLDILASFAVSNLVHPKKLPIDNFEALHAAWEQIFNIELLNERFYKELSNWYFWALPQVEFPADLEPDAEKRRATGLIRLLTRLIFCWFLKEKGLIPEKLFHPTDLAKLLKGGPDIPVWDPESETSSTYYQAILQNLFFATLNQRMGKDGKGKPYRVFAKDEGFQKNRTTYDVNNLYRYEKLFAVSEEEALALFADIPFLNGGLFECLDRTEEGGTDNPVRDSGKADKIVRSTFKKRYLDGFSRNPKKRPHVPDRLFFDSGETADLSEVYGDRKRRAEKVTGLIPILNRYKFTIVENTPIDQEIALDPELLGKVFENLLASYNEETKTTARKQTGSFYTPRPIVDYMVDESLKAHLKQKVEQTFLSASSISASSASPDSQTGMSAPPISKTRRNLPHWKKDGAIYWITFRMADSLPQEKLKAWKAERDIWTSRHPEPWSEADWKEYNEHFGDKLDEWLDAGMGSRALAREDVREIVKSCLLKFDGERLSVHAAVIMPNHVHALLEPLPGYDLSKLLQGIKGASARQVNQLLGTSGTFWLDESYDHIVRSEAQYRHFLRYIVENPIKPGLKPSEYWLLKGGTDTPVCSKNNMQTGMSAPLSERLDHLFSYTDEPHQFTEPEVAALIAAIDEVKILDPACGSGAFPMGVLHKLVYILGKLDPDNNRWKQTQLAKLDSAPMREELEAAFADNNDDYGRKLYLIENCLYGVDIQPIAIQITKLRFFISLVCDQRVEQTILSAFSGKQRKANLGIRPLPNLETKFVAANTLIGLPIPEPDLFLKTLIEPIEKEIEAAYHDHFAIQRRDQKIALQKRIKTLRQKLSDTLLDGLGANEDSEVAKKARHLADWDAFDPQSTADFFDPHWMFGRSLADGFDIVIGNPPYIDSENMTNTNPDLRKYIQATYSMTKGNWDIYIAFYEKGFNLLNENGVLAFITPDKWISKPFGDTLRIRKTENIYSILKAGRDVFESANVDAIVSLFTCYPQQELRIYDIVESDIIQKHSIAKNLLEAPYAYDWLFSGSFDMFAKIESQRTKLSQIGICENACATSDAYKLKEFIQEKSQKKIQESYLKIINTGTIGKYVSKWGKREMVYLGQRYLEPVVQRSQFSANFKNSYGKKSILPKLIVKGLNLLDACLDFEGEIIPGKTTLMVTSDSPENLKFLLGLLNSRLAFFYLKEKYPASSYNLGTTFTKDMINNLPVPPLADKKSGEIIRIVDHIVVTKEESPTADTTALEREIDQLVYALYDLTPEEIAIVEGIAK